MVRRAFFFFFLAFHQFIIAEDVNAEKWIIVTTIQYPTAQVRALSEMPGWNLVVVGDKKTPLDWQLNNCVYLSPDKQLALGFDLANLLPWNHYSRKNIGYLYAIAHGAKIIYETDDDNEPIGLLTPCETDNELPSLTTNGACINIYSYFGGTDIWPRGYPLNEITKTKNARVERHSRCRIGVEQGLINGDPDVDAIYRLTHVGEVFFQPQESCYLPRGTFCPFNSQSTFFHRDAFFTLYLPSSVTMRVCDIWRGYIAQRLLWEINQVLVFSKPNAFQLRNAHSLLADFVQESDLYTKSGQLIHFLRNWESSNSDHYLSMLQLVDDLIAENFLHQGEAPLIEAWFRDLKKAESMKNQ